MLPNIPFLLFLSLSSSSLIFLNLINGTTAKITIIPNVASGRSNNRGVANSSVNITIKVVVIDDTGLYDPTDSLTADREKEPDTGYAPENSMQYFQDLVRIIPD